MEIDNLTDEQLLERYKFDLSFRKAMGLTDFNEHILSEMTLYNFRSAIAEYNSGAGYGSYGTRFSDVMRYYYTQAWD